jgi:hypothetical protein
MVDAYHFLQYLRLNNKLVAQLLRHLRLRAIYIFVPEALPTLSLMEQIGPHSEGRYTIVVLTK